MRRPLPLLLLLAGCAVAAPRAPIEGTLVVMGTTDTHGWLLPVDYYTGRETPYGLARLVPLVDSVRAAHPGRTILLESGDLLQGNALALAHSRLAPGEVHPVAAAMNHLGYDAAALGNHEFNYGLEHLGAVMEQSRFPWLSANIFLAPTGTTQHAYRPYTLVERSIGGRRVRIGITALTPPGVAIWDRDQVEGRLQFQEQVSSVAPIVAELRRQGADVVVLAVHGGLEGSSYDTAATGVPAENASAAIAREVPGIDLILMGHTHREVADTTINGVLVQQAKNWGTSLAVAELRLRSDGGRWTVASRRGTILRPAADARAPGLEAVLAAADARTRAFVSRRIGTSTAEWSAARSRVEDTPILDLVNEVQREVTGADLSAAAAFSLESRIPAGPITVADVAGLYIYDNTLKAVRISGAGLRAFLEKTGEYYLPCPGGRCERVVDPAVPGYNFDVVSGVEYALDLTRPVGERIVYLRRDGRDVAATDSFTLALNSYRASGSGGYNMLIGLPVVYDRGEGIRELLIAAIERRGRIDPAAVFRRNWELRPAAVAERALAEQR